MLSDAAPRPKITSTRTSMIEIKVPHYAVGAIIGAKGANIREIQEDSGARLNMKDGEPRTSDERTVIVRGTAEQAQRAEYLIHKIVAEVPRKIDEDVYVPMRAVGRIIGKFVCVCVRVFCVYVFTTQGIYESHCSFVSISCVYCCDD